MKFYKFENNGIKLGQPNNWSQSNWGNDLPESINIKGKKQFIIEDETIVLEAGQSIKVEKQTRLQYSNPFAEPCEYIAICLPAFSIDSVNRE